MSYRRRPRREIPPNRKLLYYGGMAIMVCGFVVFATTFFIGPEIGGGKNQPGGMGFKEDARATHREFREGMKSKTTRAIFGVGLIAIGGFMRHVGARGAAGSGLLLDPKRAREDLEPWSRMGGGMVDDALSEVDLSSKLGRASTPEREIMVRCSSCRTLNDEEAQFCDNCGKAI